MDIGRQVLSDADFANLWAVLYQELYSLTTTKSCDATLVYNTIYIICTSNSSFEEKLYWKIGDFLYNRCKCHKNEILIAKDYLKEYINQFEQFDMFVCNVNKLGCFLNESVKGRKLDDFGYLLWERVVIQNLKKSFFEDVFDYESDDRIKIVRSFSKIKPEETDLLLYYNERYEKIAIEKIRNKYKSNKIDNLINFSKNVKDIMNYEKQDLKTRFLVESYQKVIEIIENSIFNDKYYELILNMPDFIKYYNNEKVEVVLAANNVKSFDSADHSFHTFQNKSNSFNYELLSMDKIEKLKQFIDQEFFSNKALSQIFHLINRNVDQVPKEDTSSTFSVILSQLISTNTGFIILKKAFALYIDSIIQSNLNFLCSSVENIYFHLESLDLFNCEQFKMILNSIFKYYLQRSKPCFMNRLCNYTKLISGSTFKNISEEIINYLGIVPSDELYRLKPYFKDNSNTMMIQVKIFKKLFDLIADRREFLNIYQNVLKKRLLKKQSDLNCELFILSLLNIQEEDNLYKMIKELDMCNGNILLLNGISWGIEPENDNLIIPKELILEVAKQFPRLVIHQTDDKMPYKTKFNNITKKKNVSETNVIQEQVRNQDYGEVKISMEDKNKMDKSKIIEKTHLKLDLIPNQEVKYRITGNDNSQRIVKLAHQYSNVIITINEMPVKMNIYQYSIIELLRKEKLNLECIASELLISEILAKNVLNSLLKHRIAMLKDNLYFLNSNFKKTNQEARDYLNITEMEILEENNVDICIDTYIQSLIARLLKKTNTMMMSNLISEIKSLSKLQVEDDKILSSIDKLVEKGLSEIRNGIIEYVL